MAIEAKATFLTEVERTLSTVLTVADMSKTMAAIADRLAHYSMEKTDFNVDGPDDLLEAFIGALSVEGKSNKTINRYRYIIDRLRAAVKVPTREITVYHIRRYLADEKARGISDRTLEGNRQVYSSYFGWLFREGLIAANPVVNLGTIKFAKKERDIYSEADIERMKFKCRTLRDRAILCFLQSTGCRISEMTQLNKDDVDLNNLECKVLGKGNKERTVFLSQVAAMTLGNYLNTRTDDSEALFTGRGSARLTPGGVRTMLVKLGKDANVNHVHPHKFRRTTATTLIRHGMPIQEVAAILGHDKLDTTMKYVVLDKTDVKNSYRKYA